NQARLEDPVRCLDRFDPDARRHPPFDALMERLRPSESVRKPLEAEGTIIERRQDVRRNLDVVAEEIRLREAERRPNDTLELIDLERRAVVERQDALALRA